MRQFEKRYGKIALGGVAMGGGLFAVNAHSLGNTARNHR